MIRLAWVGNGTCGVESLGGKIVGGGRHSGLAGGVIPPGARRPDRQGHGQQRVGTGGPSIGIAHHRRIKPRLPDLHIRDFQVGVGRAGNIGPVEPPLVDKRRGTAGRDAESCRAC